MANNADALDQSPSNQPYQHTTQARLLSHLKPEIHWPLTQQIKLVEIQLQTHIYEEELKDCDGTIREALHLIASEVVLWHYRRNPKSFPRKFEPMHDLAEFCKILREDWEPYTRDPLKMNRPYPRKLDSPPKVLCGVFRNDAFESTRERNKRQKLHSENPDTQHKAFPPLPYRKKGQPVFALVTTAADTAGLFPKFVYRDNCDLAVAYNDIAFRPDFGTILADLMVDFRRRQEKFVSQENEGILMAAARRRLIYFRLSEEERRQLNWMGPQPQAKQLQERLLVPEVRWDQSFHFLTELCKRWSEE